MKLHNATQGGGKFGHLKKATLIEVWRPLGALKSARYISLVCVSSCTAEAVYSPFDSEKKKTE